MVYSKIIFKIFIVKVATAVQRDSRLHAVVNWITLALNVWRNSIRLSDVRRL